MNNALESAMHTVLEYKYAIDFLGSWQGYSFEQISCSRWAADEILNALEESAETPPLLVISQFRDKAEKYSHYNERANTAFSIAYEVAESIIDNLIN